ncbi:MAG: TonB-dependent receptor [Novosphingobium sp.]
MREIGIDSVAANRGTPAWLGRKAALAAAMGCTALTATLAAPAYAQSANVTTDESAIIVTAQRRSEALEDVPMTVNYLSGETLANAGVNSVRDLANVTTGFSLGQGGSVPQPAMRGVTTLINGSYENNVAVYIDGVYQTVPAAMNIDLPNIANVQILKGPQGTLYGRNATGGAILVQTITPGDRWEGRAEATYANFDDKRLSAYVAGPLNDMFGIALTGYLRETDGYFKKLSRTQGGETDGHTFGLKQEAFRAKLATDFSDSIRATLGYAYTRSKDARGVHFSPIENAPLSYNLPGGRIPGSPNPAVVNGELLLPQKLGQTAFDFDPTVDIKQNEAFLNLEFDTAIGQIRSLTAWQDSRTRTNYDFDGSYLPAFYSTSRQGDRTIQQTLDYQIDAVEGLDLLLGGQYFNIKSDNKDPTTTYFGYVFQGRTNYVYDGTEIPLSTYIIDNQYTFNRTKEAFAVYADATIHFTDSLSLNVGGRYSVEDQNVESVKVGRGGFAANPQVFLFDTNSSAVAPGYGAKKSSSYDKFTPRVSLRYEINPSTSVYASYTQGFKSGEWNSAVPNNDPRLWIDVDQESIEAFEVGVKSASSSFRFDLAGFYYDYTDLQVSTTTFVPGFGTLVLLQNAPKAEIYGAEGNFEWEPIENAHIRGGATWLHARYGDNFLFSGVSVNPASTGVSGRSDPLKNFVNTTRTQDLSGKQMSRAPNFAAYLGGDYRIPMGEGGFVLAANLKYTDSYVVTNPSIWGGDLNYTGAPGQTVDNGEVLAGTPYADKSNKQRFRQSGYVLVNASITWSDASDRIFVRLWGNNLTDERYRLHYSGTSTFGTYSPMAEPRTYGATIGYKFKE